LDELATKSLDLFLDFPLQVNVETINHVRVLPLRGVALGEHTSVVVVITFYPLENIFDVG
jgi:hypothetical protein